MAVEIAAKIIAGNPRREGSSVLQPPKVISSGGSWQRNVYEDRAYLGQPNPSGLANRCLRTPFSQDIYGE